MPIPISQKDALLNALGGETACPLEEAGIVSITIVVSTSWATSVAGADPVGSGIGDLVAVGE